MKYQLTAPPDLLPQLAARLAHNATTLEYCLRTPQLESLDAGMQILIFQPDFFHPGSKHTNSIDVFVVPTPFSTLQGFMLIAGGSHANLAQAAPLLDALAPLPAGWLHAGELGSAAFFSQLWHLLTGHHAAGPLPFWQNMPAPNTGSQINGPDLVNQLSSLMAQQQLLTQSLASCAQRFITDYPAQEFIPYHPQQAQLIGSGRPYQRSPAHEIATLLSSFQIQ